MYYLKLNECYSHKQTRSLLNLFNLPLQVFDHENNKTVDVREIGTIIRSLGHCPSVSQLQVGTNQSKMAALPLWKWTFKDSCQGWPNLHLALVQSECVCLCHLISVRLYEYKPSPFV
jgi:hypothetical protein